MKIFLTGGTGYLGRALLAGLLEAGHQVTVLSRRPDPELEHPRLRWIEGDLRAGPPPADLLMQHRAVLHAAALVKTWVRDRSEFDRVNVDAWDQLLEVCARAGVPRILHTSSFISLGPSVVGRKLREADRGPRETFLTDYERTKYKADLVTERWAARGIPVITLYPTVVFGPGPCTDGNLVGKLIWMIARRRFPGIFGTGAQVWDFAYLPDVVQGHLQALERALPGQGYILGGENVRLDHLVEQVQALLGRAPSVRRIPIEVAEALGSILEGAAPLTNRAPDLTRGVASVYRHDWSYDCSKAERDLGYTRTSFASALEETVRWAKQLRRWG